MKSRPISNWFKVVVIFGALATSAEASTKPVLNDWFALGSGCRARNDLPGNVKMENIPSDPTNSNLYRAKFTFQNFALKGESIESSRQKYGRECAVRLNINPPTGKKIVALRARTKLNTAKEVGPSLDVLSELKLGAVSIGRIQRKLEGSAKVAAREDIIDLEAGEGATEPLPQLGCGEAKIIGFDYSWIVTRESEKSGNLKVELSKDKSLVIEATLADCK